MHFISEQFDDLINYPHFSDLFTSLVELAKDFEADDDVAPDLKGEERVEFFDAIRDNFCLARITQLWHDRHFEEAKTVFDAIIQRRYEANNPFNIEELKNLIAPLRINIQGSLLLRCLKQKVQIEEAIALLDDITDRMPPHILSAYATWIAKRDKDKGVAVAKMAISKSMTIIGKKIHSEEVLVVAAEIALALRDLCLDEADALFLKAFEQRGLVKKRQARFAALVLQHGVATKQSDEANDSDQRSMDLV